MNVQGQITVVELPGGNLKGAQLLVGPRLLGPGVDLCKFIKYLKESFTNYLKGCFFRFGVSLHGSKGFSS
jgi:hypothetical protein